MTWLTKQTVVIPIDFSTNSLKAAKVARTMVSYPRYLHLVHVIHPLEDGSGADFVKEGVALDDVREARSRDLLRSHLSGFEFEGATLHTAIGDPGSEILKLAEEVEASLIVISSHGRTGLSRLVIGSVAERVVRYSKCPVLVLRGEIELP